VSEQEYTLDEYGKILGRHYHYQEKKYLEDILLRKREISL